MLAETAPFDGAGFYAVDFSGFIDSEDLVERVFHHFFTPFFLAAFRAEPGAGAAKKTLAADRADPWGKRCTWGLYLHSGSSSKEALKS